MKKLNLLFVAIVFIATSIFGQSSDLSGEDFDLEALAGIIESVSTFEDLEKAINTESNEVNNLDLDKNGEVDYVLIQMEKEGDTYVAFLRVAMSETEMQDVATIEMEKQSSTTAFFQIVGDEALYGKDYILEPEGGLVDISESSSGSTGGKGGPSFSYIPPPPAVRVTICVGVFRPGFRVWVSPYGVIIHPAWFRPWRPVARHHYRARAARWHRSRYHRAAHHRSHHARNMHKKHHRSSAKVSHHNSSAAKKNTTSSAAKSNNQKSNTQYNSSQQQKSNQQYNSSQQKSNQQKKSSQQKKSGSAKGGKR